MNSLHLDGVLFEEFEESADNYQESHNYGKIVKKKYFPLLT